MSRSASCWKPSPLRFQSAGFTMIELVTVIVLMGILGAIGYARFADTSSFENRAYSDQARTIIRYAQKLAVTQNRAVFVRSEPNGFAVCYQAGCGNGAALAPAPGGRNSGSAGTRGYCTLNNTYISNWMCEGRPNNNVVVTSDTARNEFGVGGSFFFDALGRPYNANDVLGNSTFTRMTLTFTRSGASNTVVIEADTGYVH
ncbi:prepilin-type N-terminal cleavage/methylation domain-containing protein [Pseudoduganella sp. FT55W]|uniref:Prepilin-type N-terminal cleavage/methylation domain-containing protein n=1 Tax=Duganella rivi TaxID=2666083 RepID=A0A7X4GQ59_9BURK|nr:prepilin-type N-terminal cleavage/methylation domain-containing protein [Duganella rivi]MYM67635.1 prepilin-type N-terminal cleavage/methylation domain-containing protein [Duganella rivi]